MHFFRTKTAKEGQYPLWLFILYRVQKINQYDQIMYLQNRGSTFDFLLSTKNLRFSLHISKKSSNFAVDFEKFDYEKTYFHFKRSNAYDYSLY